MADIMSETRPRHRERHFPGLCEQFVLGTGEETIETMGARAGQEAGKRPERVKILRSTGTTQHAVAGRPEHRRSRRRVRIGPVQLAQYKIG
jgi:hypothetical protein